ncbi:MAG: DUF7507 domain-containing protein [Comamonas sp.]
MSATNGSTRGMTSQASLYCARINITPAGTVQVVNVTPDGTPTSNGFAYPQPGTEQTAYCPAGQVVQRLGGYDRTTPSPYNTPWASSLVIACRPANTGAGDWVQIDTGATATEARAGVVETNATHNFRGYFCPNAADQAVSGIYRQAGGEGYDGINVYCGQLQQARLSAIMTFTDFAWDQTLGGSGWLVNLTRDGTLLDNLAGMSGENKTPYAAAGDNDPEDYQPDSELYVLPNAGYGAVVSQRPSGIAENTYVVLNTCAAGTSIGNKQDQSCTLNVAGRPDIFVDITPPPIRYNSVGQTQNLTLTAINLGPGDVGDADGFALRVEIPAGWTPGSVPGCTVSGQVLTCPIDTVMAAAPAPGANGGQLAFTIPVTTNASVTSGTRMVTASLERSTPDDDDDPTNDDYDTDNDTDVAPLDFLAGTPSLGINKITRGGAGSFSFSGNNGWDPQTITTTQNLRTAYGDIQVLDAAHVETTITESLPPRWKLSSVNCTGMAPGGTVTVGPTSFTLSASAIAADSEIACTVVNDTPELRVTKTSSAVIDTNGDGKVNAGDTVNFTIRVENIGPITISNLSIDDPLLGMSAVPLNPSSLAPAESASVGPISYTLTQQDIYNGKVTNTATANGADPDGNPVSATGSVTTPVAGSPEMTLDKAMSNYTDVDGDGRRSVGDRFSYTLTVKNIGGVRLTGVSIDDPKLSTTPLAVTPANLEPGQSGTASGDYTLTQTDVDAGFVTNDATASGKTPAGGDVSAFASQVERIAPVAEMTLTKSAGAVTDANGNGYDDVGDTITYTFSVENTGNVTLNSVAISDPKLGVSGLAVSPATLAPHQTGTASATYTLTQADFDAGEVRNTATASGMDPDGGGPISDEAFVTTPLAGDPRLTVAKDASPSSAALSDTVTYTIRVSNSGPRPSAANTTITDYVREGVTVTQVDSGTGWACNPTSGAGPMGIDCVSAAGVPAGAVDALVATITTTKTTTSAVTNTASVSSGDAECEANPPPARCGATATVGDNSQPVLAMGKAADKTSAALGESITYTVQVSNSGPVASAANTTINDNVPEGLSVVGVTNGTGWSCSPTTGTGPVTIACVNAAGVAAGASNAPVATITATKTGTSAVTNSASVGSGDPACAETPVPDRCSAAVVVADSTQPVLSVSKAADKASAAQGEAITYTVQVSNSGAVPSAAKTIISDNLSEGLELTAVSSGDGWTCTPTAGAGPLTIQCVHAAGVPAGASKLPVATITATKTGTNAVRNTVSITQGDETCQATPAPERCVDVVPVADASQPALALAKSADPASAAQGGRITYTIRVGNSGPVASAANTTVSDAVPAGLALVSVTDGTGWVCDNSVSCVKAAGVAAGAADETVATVVATKTGTTAVTNTARVASGDLACESDVPAARCTSSATVADASQPALALAKSAAPASAAQGENITCSIRVSNSGQVASAADTTVTDTLPAGLSLVSVTAGEGWTCDNSIRCTKAGGVAAGTTDETVVTVVATKTGTASVTNTASVASGDAACEATPVAGRCSSSATVQDGGSPPAPALAVAKAADRASARRGETIHYRIQVGNSGPVASGADTTIVDSVPEGLRVVAVRGGEGWACTPGSGEGPVDIRCVKAAGVAAGAAQELVAEIVSTKTSSGAVTNTASVTRGGGPGCDAPASDCHQTASVTVADADVGAPASIPVDSRPMLAVLGLLLLWAAALRLRAAQGRC